MPFGRKARRCITYRYRIRPTGPGREQAIDQMFRRVRLWNMLVEVEQAYREDLMTRVGEDRKLKEAFQDPEFVAWHGHRDQLRRYAVADAVSAAGLYWCNSDDVLTAYNTARRKPDGIRFHSWRLENGKVSVRFQYGLSQTDLGAETDGRLQLRLVDPAVYRDRLTPGRDARSHSLLRLRVGSAERRQPIWFEADVTLHRPLPPGLIRSAAVIRERLGSHERWHLVIVVELEDQAPPVPSPTARGVIALDVGWRRVADGLRVALWRDDTGQQGEVVLPHSWLNLMNYADKLQLLRQNACNVLREDLLDWLKDADREQLPVWFRETAVSWSRWRQPGRFAAFALRWREAVEAGEDTWLGPAWGHGTHQQDTAGIYQRLQAWRRMDRKLWDEHASLVDRLVAERRESYRQFAATVAHRYERVVMEDLDLRRLARRKAPAKTDAVVLHAGARHQRWLAAVSVLRLALADACGRTGTVIEKRKTAFTTRTCHVCGGEASSTGIVALWWQCEQCGAEWDQDDNAARNLLAAARNLLA